MKSTLLNIILVDVNQINEAFFLVQNDTDNIARFLNSMTSTFSDYIIKYSIVHSSHFEIRYLHKISFNIALKYNLQYHMQFTVILKTYVTNVKILKW